MAAGDTLDGALNMLYMQVGSTWKIVGCLENLSWTLSGDTNDTVTKCGTYSYAAPSTLEITGSGVAISDVSPDTRVSLPTLKSMKKSRTKAKFRVGQPGDLNYIEGLMNIGDVSSTSDAADLVKFDISLNNADGNWIVEAA